MYSTRFHLAVLCPSFKCQAVEVFGGSPPSLLSHALCAVYGVPVQLLLPPCFTPAIRPPVIEAK